MVSYTCARPTPDLEQAGQLDAVQRSSSDPIRYLLHHARHNRLILMDPRLQIQGRRIEHRGVPTAPPPAPSS